MSKESEVQVNQLAHGTRQVTNLDQIGEAHIELIDIKQSINQIKGSYIIFT